MAAIVGAAVEWEQDGRRYGKITAVQDDDVSPVAVADEFFVALPPLCRAPVFHCDLSGAGTAANLRPEIGFTPGFTLNGEGFIRQAVAADANHRITDLVYLHDGVYVRPTPNVDLDGTQVITTTIRYIYGE